MNSELFDFSGLRLAELLRRREVSSLELTKLFLERAVENWSLGAFVSLLEGAALREAKARDAELSRSHDVLAPFHGVPMGVKDLDMVRMSFTRFGSRAFRYLFTPFDGPSAKKLREGGFVVIGKLATSELGAMPVTETDLHEPARNPWDLSRTSGGSSGGSATAVAARLLPVAHASDGGGSIRIPAAFCGLFGMKPSRGRLVNPYAMTDAIGLSTIGPISRDVDDGVAVLDVLAYGSERGRPKRGLGFAELATRAPRKLRVRFTAKTSIGPTDPERARAIERAAKLAEDLGHYVEEAPSLDGSLEEFLPLWKRQLSMVPIPFGDASLQPITRWLREGGRALSAESARAMATNLSARAHDWFGDADIVLTPAVAVPPPVLGSFRGLDPAVAFERAAIIGAFTAVYNLTGQPAASVPFGMDAAGLPIGVQIAAPWGRDDHVLQMAKQFEVAAPWHTSAPPAGGRRVGASVSPSSSP
ncbi:MAG: amidase [Polyangiaceae bacterium]